MGYDPTLDDSYRKQCIIDGERCLLEVFENPGAEYKAIRNQLYRQADGVIFVYSINSWPSLDSIKPLREGWLAAKGKDCAPMVFVGNQCDREQDEWEVLALEGKILAREFGCPHMEVSARTGFNVDAGFYQIVREIWRSEAEIRSVGDSAGEDGQPAITGATRPTVRKTIQKLLRRGSKVEAGSIGSEI